MTQHQANWINSGMAQEAARELAWFVVLVLVAVGVAIYRDIKKDNRTASPNVRKVRGE